MERLTYRIVDGPNAGKVAIAGKGTALEKLELYPVVFERLAAYEDTGLMPGKVKEINEAYCEILTRTYGPLHQKIGAWLKAEEEGRLVVLPCKVGDTVYVVGESKVVECNIDEAFLDDRTGQSFLVTFDCDTDCEGCPFNSWAQEYSGEWSCGGEYGNEAIKGSDFGKTVFLTREEAEAALANVADINVGGKPVNDLYDEDGGEIL